MPNPSQTFSHDSLAGVPEPELVRRLLADTHWRGRLLGLHGIPTDANNYPEVLLDDLGKKGDVDILLVNPSRPEFATAIQAKRIKVAAQTFQTGKPNRLVAVAELHRQANLLVELGFWQVLCYAIVAVEGPAGTMMPKNKTGGSPSHQSNGRAGSVVRHSLSVAARRSPRR